MTALHHTLDDAAIQDFIVHGYTLIKADQPASFHQAIYDKIETVFGAEGNPGNNLLPRIPEIQEIFTSPSVDGALTSLLGPGYSMHPHRYCHLNSPGGQGQNWHKDDYIYDQNVRHHRYRWVMAFYYPQDVSPDMGATGILSGRQYYNHISTDDPTQSTEQEISLCGPAGTVALVNFDVWHRATANTSNKKRYMLKFQFLRMTEPRQPSWQHSQAQWQPVATDRHTALSASVWHWLCGQPTVQDSTTTNPPLSPHELRAADETTRLDAAYTLASQGIEVIPQLVHMLHTEVTDLALSNQAKNQTNPAGGNPAELYSAHALSALGPSAVPELIVQLQHDHWGVRAAAADILGNIGSGAHTAIEALTYALQDDNLWVRRNAAEALGTIAPQVPEAIDGLAALAADQDERVRRNVALALAKIGRAAHTAVPAICQLLNDENRYVRFNAILALQHIGTPEASTALWDHLLVSRWCPITTQETPF